MNPKQKAELDAWLTKAVKSSGKQIERSQVFLSIFTGGYEKDPLAALQFGIAVLLDKPIYLVVPHGTKIPDNVRKIAKAIEYYDPNDPNDIKAATSLLVNRFKTEGKS